MKARRGSDLEPAELWPEIAGLACFGIVMLTLGTLRFRKRLE